MLTVSALFAQPDNAGVLLHLGIQRQEEMRQIEAVTWSPFDEGGKFFTATADWFRRRPGVAWGCATFWLTSGLRGCSPFMRVDSPSPSGRTSPTGAQNVASATRCGSRQWMARSILRNSDPAGYCSEPMVTWRRVRLSLRPMSWRAICDEVAPTGRSPPLTRRDAGS